MPHANGDARTFTPLYESRKGALRMEQSAALLLFSSFLFQNVQRPGRWLCHVWRCNGPRERLAGVPNSRRRRSKLPEPSPDSAGVKAGLFASAFASRAPGVIGCKGWLPPAKRSARSTEQRPLCLETHVDSLGALHQNLCAGNSQASASPDGKHCRVVWQAVGCKPLHQPPELIAAWCALLNTYSR